MQIYFFFARVSFLQLLVLHLCCEEKDVFCRDYVQAPVIMKKILHKAVYALLLGYYALKEPSVSLKDKGIIYGALAYFVIPFDFIHDWLPFAGVADDFMALVWAVSRVMKNITPEVRKKAVTRLSKWFRLTQDEIIRMERGK